MSDSEIQDDSHGVSEETFICSVQTRWLQTSSESADDVVNRVLNLWPTLEDFCSSQLTVEDDIENRSRLKNKEQGEQERLFGTLFWKNCEMLLQKDNHMIHKLDYFYT